MTHPVREKYSTSNYDPKADCPFCAGTGEKERKIIDGEMCGGGPCICIFVDHEDDASTKIGRSLGTWARKQRLSMEAGAAK